MHEANGRKAYPLSCVLGTEGQLVGYIEDGDRTLRVVRELGRTVTEEHLVFVVHYVSRAVPGARQSRFGTIRNITRLRRDQSITPRTKLRQELPAVLFHF